MASFCVIRRISNMLPRLQKNNPSYKYFDNWTEEDTIYHDAKTNEYATDGAIKYNEIINEYYKTTKRMFEYHLELNNTTDNKQK